MVRTVFFGTPAFAVPTLERLLRSAHEVRAVVTQPDRKRGRGHKVSPPPVKAVAQRHGVEVFQPARLRDTTFLSALAALTPEVGIVAAYGKLLPDELLQLPRFGMLNVHASLLPKYRGAAPVHRAVMAGETETGVTIIRLVQEMDAGPMLGRVSEAIMRDDTSETVADRLSSSGADLLVQVLAEVEAGRAHEVPQDHTRATFAPRLSRADGVIDWTRPAEQIRNQIRGLHPWPHAFSHLEGTRYTILRARVVTATAPGRSPLTPGVVLEAGKDALVVACGASTALALDEIQPEGKRALPARAFLTGYRLRPGMTFAPGVV